MTDLHHTTTETRPAPSPRRWGVLAVLTLSLFVVVMDMTILNVALPDLIEDLHLSSVSQLWVVDIYALVLAGLIIPVTALGDRWGRKRMLMLGFAIFGGASLLVVFADSAGAVIALRGLLGLGGAMIMPSTLSLIRAAFADARERALALSIWGASAAAGGAIGPLVGGALLEHFSWHAAFLFNVPLMLIGLGVGAWLLTENRSSHPGRLDATGVLLSAGGTALTVYAFKHLGKDGLNPVDGALLLLGLLTVVLFVRRCLRDPRPMLDVRLFANPVLRAGVLAALASSFAMIAVMFAGSQWLQLVLDWTPLQTGAALLPTAIAGVVATPFAPALAARTSPRIVLTGGLAVLGAGLALIAVLPTTYPWMALAFAIVGLGTSALGLGSALIMGSATDAQAGSAAAIEEMTYEVGSVLGVTLLGSLLSIAYRAGLPDGTGAAVRESVAGAIGTEWFAGASDAFVDAFSIVGAAGAIAVAVTAWLVWRQIPRTLRLEDTQH